ncbi:MAG: hypothetical protein KDD35_07125 [Bdellovibrionales bacterium]|nr:hypothetical protein [Bdellovibrionales bacterium]
MKQKIILAIVALTLGGAGLWWFVAGRHGVENGQNHEQAKQKTPFYV